MPDAVGPATLNQVVVVIYDSPKDREVAYQQITEQIPSQIAANCHWCQIAQLGEKDHLETLTRHALDAQLIVVAARAEGDFSSEVKSFIERWVSRRQDREGTLVGLLTETSRGSVASLKEIYLRHTAHRVGMDYLSQLSPNASRAIPDSLDTFSRRADQMTSLLDEILRTETPPVPPR